jgi:hypothetical protein
VFLRKERIFVKEARKQKKEKEKEKKHLRPRSDSELNVVYAKWRLSIKP